MINEKGKRYEFGSTGAVISIIEESSGPQNSRVSIALKGSKSAGTKDDVPKIYGLHTSNLVDMKFGLHNFFPRTKSSVKQEVGVITKKEKLFCNVSLDDFISKYHLLAKKC